MTDSAGNVLKTGNVVVLDTALAVVDVLQVGIGPSSAAMFGAMANERIYVPSSEGTLTCIDPSTHAVIASTNLGGFLTGVAFAPDGKLYIAEFLTSTLRTVTVGGTPASDVIGDSYVLPANSSPFGISLIPLAAPTGATLRVPQDYPTPQAAVDASISGDVIQLAPALYMVLNT